MQSLRHTSRFSGSEMMTVWKITTIFVYSLFIQAYFCTCWRDLTRTCLTELKYEIVMKIGQHLKEWWQRLFRRFRFMNGTVSLSSDQTWLAGGLAGWLAGWRAGGRAGGLECCYFVGLVDCLYVNVKLNVERSHLWIVLHIDSINVDVIGPLSLLSIECYYR